MNTIKVITNHQCGWIDSYIDQPPNGSRVQALSKGGVQISVVWNSHSIDFCDAWQPHQRVPAVVRARQLGRFTGSSI
jgi:hypothetical protein